MTPGAAFLLLTLLVLATAALGIRKYRTPLNPLTIFALYEIAIGELFSGLVVYYVVRPMAPWSTAKYPDKFITLTALIACAYVIGSALPYFFRQRLFLSYYARLIRFLGLASEGIGAVYAPWKMVVILGAAALSFAVLAVVGGGGILWVLHPREAYGTSKLAANPFYAGTQWLLMLSFLYYLWSRRPRGARLVLVLSVYTVLNLFLASKAIIMISAFVAAAYYHFRVRPIPTWVQLAAVPAGVALTLILIVAQGTERNAAESIIYYQDYFDSTAWFLSRFHEFGYHYGSVALSYLWAYVPRALFPDKPFYWGHLYVNQMLYPGLLEQGTTPASMQWTTLYMDFGLPGVFVGGFLTSVFRKVVYDYYRAHPKQLIPFLFALQIGLLSILTLAPMPIPLVLGFVYAVFLRLVIRPGAQPSAGRIVAPS